MINKFRHIMLYVLILILTGIALIVVLKSGTPSHMTVIQQPISQDWVQTTWAEIRHNLEIPLVGFIIQILVILAFSQVCAHLLKLIDQPKVIGEMMAGILLGKSVFFYVWPTGFAALFPDASMPQLYFLSQIGLILFMFVVGLHLKTSEMKGRGGIAVLVSHVSIVVPFILGSILALGLFKDFGPANHSFTSFALFIGIAMSVTAFPVLARILEEKQLTRTPLGAMALTCAAVDDVTAWCLLAAVIGIAKAGTVMSAISVLGLSLVYVVIMLKLVRPFVEKILRPVALDGELSRGQLAFLFCVLLGSALAAEIIGIHALFGAFLAGTVMPQSQSFRSSLASKIEDMTSVLLLPLFFAYTGLRTQIGLLNSLELWLICLGIIFLAVVGKMVASVLVAKASGMNWQESWALGALMNTRGLMELVVLNIGYDLGILSPQLFAMFVIMAISTTAMTSPLLSFFLAEKRLTELNEGGLTQKGANR